MKNYHRNPRHGELQRTETNEYPLWSMLAAMGLIYLTPFVAAAAYLAFAVCVYRAVRYDIRVFSVDYCVIMPISLLFRTTGGMSFMVYLSLIAAIWEIVRNGLRGDAILVTLLVLLNYLLARMQLRITNFLLCFGQILLLCMMLPKQDEESAERAIRAFCLSLLLGSCYALLLRNSGQLVPFRGREAPAYQGSALYRFQGLFQDPNYYMCMLVAGISLVIRLGELRRMETVTFWVLLASFSAFGILTYSKTFFLLFVVLVLTYVYLQFRNRRYVWGMTLVILGLSLGGFLLLSPRSPFYVVVTRLLEANNFNALTTGRVRVFRIYLEEILGSPQAFFFGKGMAQAAPYKKDPHNLFLEITYYTGVIGLGLFAAWYWSLLHVLKKRFPRRDRQTWVSRYLVLIMAVGMFCTLHGMYTAMVYAIFYMAALPVILPKKEATR